MILSLLFGIVCWHSAGQELPSAQSPYIVGDIAGLLLKGPFLEAMRSDDLRSYHLLENRFWALAKLPTATIEDGLILAVERSQNGGVSLHSLEQNLSALNRLLFEVPTKSLFPWRLEENKLVLGPIHTFTSGPMTAAVTEFRQLKNLYRRRSADSRQVAAASAGY